MKVFCSYHSQWGKCKEQDYNDAQSGVNPSGMVRVKFALMEHSVPFHTLTVTVDDVLFFIHSLKTKSFINNVAIAHRVHKMYTPILLSLGNTVNEKALNNRLINEMELNLENSWDLVRLSTDDRLKDEVVNNLVIV